MPKLWRPADERFRECYATDAATGCWLWQRQTGAYGYGTFALGKAYGDPHATTGAHRAAWVLYRGPIPDGQVVDHLCRNRACVNPDHLQVVTQGENVRRSARYIRAHCIHGHPWTEANTYWRPDGARTCRQCAIRHVAHHGRRYRDGTAPRTVDALTAENAALKQAFMDLAGITWEQWCAERSQADASIAAST